MSDKQTEQRTESISSVVTESTETESVTSNYKVLGKMIDENGVGVLGQNDATSGTPIGVRGAVPNATGGYGLYTTDDLFVDGTCHLRDVVARRADISNVGVEAVLSSDFQIPNERETTVVFNTTFFDDTDNFDTTSGAYTLPYAGDYQIDVGIDWSEEKSFADGDLSYLFVSVNDATRVVEKTNYAGGPYPKITVSKVVKGLSEGNVLTVDVYQATGGSRSVHGGSRAASWFCINKIA